MLYVGVMTGTSVDGLDVALLRAADELSIVAAETVPLPAELAASLKALAAPADNEVVRLGSADARLGEFIGESVLACLDRWAVSATDIRAIGSHGQTVRHHPDAEPAFTVQIGDPNRIAEISGIDTVADFRRRDMAAGGEGAPLVPLFHAALFRHAARTRVVVNIGGIANVTVLPSASTALFGFDTGPGNALMDAWSRQCRHLPFDQDGRWAATGNAAPTLLAKLAKDPFIRRQPPKSTGKERYHIGYVRAACAELALAPEDVQASLAEFTAWSIADAIDHWASDAIEVIACGGGRRNAYLMQRLAANVADRKLCTSDDLGLDGDGLEAAAFAWFAHRTLQRQPSNAPAATGARGPRVLGAVYAANPARRRRLTIA